MKALVLILDGLPARCVLDGLGARGVGAAVTPAIDALAAEGGWAPDGGRAVMTTSTAPNLATFATGTTPNRHGIPAAHVPVGDGADVVSAHEHGPAVPSLFEVLRHAGRSSGIAVSDPRTLGVMGAARCDRVHSPEANGTPNGSTDVEQVAADDEATTDALVAMVEDPPDLVVGHLRLPDAAAHVHGPDDPAAIESYRETDRRVARILEPTAREWDEWTVAVLSDHDQEEVLHDREPVDLQHRVDAVGLPLVVVPEGGAALVLGTDRRHGQWLTEVAGVAGSIELGDRVRLVWARPGRVFGPGDRALPRSVHGGPATTTQVAVVGGGHPAVERLASGLRRRAPGGADWAVTLAELLGVPLPTATGRSLL